MLRAGMIAAVLIPILLIGRPLDAQCPDGSPPPCLRPPPVQPRRASGGAPGGGAPIDSATALVVPLAPVGADTALRRLAATFAAVVAENMTVGEVRARVADNLAALLIEQRAAAAARQKAGAVVDGTLLKIGTDVRATVRLVDAKSGRELATTTVEGSPDSLLALADRASVVLLTEWWARQPGPYWRSGVVTRSLPALRHYIKAMVWWREGRSQWRTLLDSAVHHDPDFLAAWTWLALPSTELGMMEEMMGPAASMMAAMRGGVSPDSALRALGGSVLQQQLRPGRTLSWLAPLGLVRQISAGAFPPPTPRIANPLGVLGAFPGQQVDLGFLKALAAHYATLAASPESLALRLASDAVALDSTFEPASRLLFSQLVDADDSAAARHVLAHLARSDTAEARDLRAILDARTATAAQVASDTSGDRVGAAAWLGTRWHRFAVVQVAAPMLKRLITQQLPATMADQLTAALGLFFDLPVYIARGMLDSAKAIPQRTVRTMQQMVGAAPGMVGVLSLPAPGLPPDIAFFPTSPDSGALDSLIRKASAPLPNIPGQPTYLDITQWRRLAVSRMILRITWYSGVLAIPRGDRRTAHRALGILDSLTVEDTLAVRPLALGLRAELALAGDSGSVAESLLVQAIGTSVTRCPSRYRLLLAQRYADTNHPELALRLAHSITMPSQLQPPEHIAYYAPALKLEGEMLERLGRREQATATYQEFVDLRANADSALQGEVREVRARLAALRR